MKSSVRTALLSAALAVTTFTGVSRAADETPKPTQPTQTDRRRFDPATLMKNYRDRFEGLNLTDEQMKKIDGFIETTEKEFKSSEGKTDRESMQARFAAYRKLGEDVQSVLNDTQKQQLAQKRRAEFGNRFKETYSNPELKLTDDQKKKIDEASDQLKKDLLAISGADGNETRQKVFDAMRAARDKVNAVLTDEQKKLLPQQRFGGRGQRNPQGNNQTKQSQ